MLLKAVRLAAVGMAAYVEPTGALLARGCLVTAALEIVVETDRIAGSCSCVHSLQFRWHVPWGSALLTFAFAVFSLALRPLASSGWRRVSCIIKRPLGCTRVRACREREQMKHHLGIRHDLREQGVQRKATIGPPLDAVGCKLAHPQPRGLVCTQHLRDGDFLVPRWWLVGRQVLHQV